MILEKRYVSDRIKPASDAWRKGPKITLDDVVNARGCIERMRPGELHGKAGVPQPAAKAKAAGVMDEDEDDEDIFA